MNHFFYTAYNSIPDTFYVLLVLIVIDYITGVCLALKEKTTSSKIGAKGIASKVLIVCMASIEKLISGWVASHAEVNLAKRYLEVTLTNIFQDIDMLPTVNYNVNALPMRRIGQH